MTQASDASSPPERLLEGIVVCDFTRVLSGPYCTRLLADLGADVIKIERPGSGDDTRSWGPPFLAQPDGRESAEAAYYLGTNRNKRSVTCDIAQPAGQALVRALAAHCDVFVENFKVGDMKRYGLDFEALRAINPRLVYCSITGFGQTGPYRDRAGYDYAVQGMGGLMSITGERDDLGGGPQKVGVAVADLFTGLYATTAILAALRHAERTGQGQHVDMALLDTQVAMLANLGANYLVSGKARRQRPPEHRALSGVRGRPRERWQRRPHHPGRGQRRSVRQVLRRGGPPRAGHRPALCAQPGSRATPRGAGADARSGDEDPHQAPVARGVRGRQSAVRRHQ
jgi:crotonobetainyl-CoA:carnitine CoA-transferase CaiB-like acyl-CoA transferase